MAEDGKKGKRRVGKGKRGGVGLSSGMVTAA